MKTALRWLPLFACLALLAAGCALGPRLGPNPARLVLKTSGQVTQADIDQAVAQTVGPLIDQPTLYHWLGPPTWEVRVMLRGEAKAIWRLETVGGGLAKPQVGLKAAGEAVFLAPPGKNRYRLLFWCVVIHYWNEGLLNTYQDPVYVYLKTVETELDLPTGGELVLSPFGDKR